MNSSKLRRPISKQQDEGLCCTIRGWLLAWGILRLLVSALWTATVTLATVENLHRLQNEEEPQETTASCPIARPRLWFDMFALLFQLVEFVMIITFITAGVKKSVGPYRAYYHYCIFNLVMYIIAVVLVITTSYDDGHYFGEIYLTLYIDIVSTELYYYLYIAAPIVIGLEILLICLIKKLINRYSSRKRCQTV